MSRYVICYQGANDPSQQEVNSLLSCFDRVKVIDTLPGTLLVDGPKAEIASAVKGMSQWTFSPERVVSVRPPRRRLKAPA